MRISEMDWRTMTRLSVKSTDITNERVPRVNGSGEGSVGYIVALRMGRLAEFY
jgi:hypothetical protein